MNEEIENLKKQVENLKKNLERSEAQESYYHECLHENNALLVEKYTPQNEGWFKEWPTEDGDYEWIYAWGCGCCIHSFGLVEIYKEGTHAEDFEKDADLTYVDSKGIKRVAYFSCTTNCEKPWLNIDDSTISIHAFRKFAPPPDPLINDRYDSDPNRQQLTINPSFFKYQEIRTKTLNYQRELENVEEIKNKENEG